jgi:hypothetical protein
VPTAKSSEFSFHQVRKRLIFVETPLQARHSLPNRQLEFIIEFLYADLLFLSANCAIYCAVGAGFSSSPLTPQALLE